VDSQSVENSLARLLFDFSVVSFSGDHCSPIQDAAKLKQNRDLLLRFACSEIVYDDEVTIAEFHSVVLDIRKVCIECTPCIKALLAGSTDARTMESATNAYSMMREGLSELCGILSPDLPLYFAVKLG
jgi:hypothetical protein